MANQQKIQNEIVVTMTIEIIWKIHDLRGTPSLPMSWRHVSVYSSLKTE
jgi:hypothetical protein